MPPARRSTPPTPPSWRPTTRWTRAGNRASDALDAASEALDAANEAVETEQSADYDPETDVGALGQAIEDAPRAGEDVSAIADAYSPVYNAGLLETLSSALSEVERAEGAVEDAAAALAAAEDAARALDPDAALSEIPAATAAETAELGDLTGTARYLTRAENYAARAQAASDSAAALSEAGSAILAEVEAAVQAHPLTFAQTAFRFARDRAVDLDVIGGVLALAGLALLLAPKSWRKSGSCHCSGRDSSSRRRSRCWPRRSTTPTARCGI